MDISSKQTSPDPTRPVLPPFHTRIKWSWVFFIGFNMMVPILFLIIYSWMQSQ